MGEAKRRRSRVAWPVTDRYDGTIDMHVLPSVAAINAARIRELTGDDTFPEANAIVLRAFKAVVGERSFHVGFCLGDGTSFSAIGIAVIERLSIESQGAALHVVPIIHEDIAWDTVVRRLRTFKGEALLFAFSDSDVYDAGTAEISYSKSIRQFGPDGTQFDRLSEGQRRKILEQKAKLLNRPSPPKLYFGRASAHQDSPWIFRIVTPAGKTIRTTVWDGRRDYAHELPHDIVRWVGGDSIAIVQVDSPVGINRRSSLDLTHKFAASFDGVIHWARDTETFNSILTSFIRLDLDSVSPPELPDKWDPEITIFAANGPREED